MAKKKNLSKFCSPIFKKQHSTKKVDIVLTSNNLIISGNPVGNNAKGTVANNK